MKTIQSSERKGNLDKKLQNQRDFSGRNLYVGIDVHKKRWQVAVIFDGQACVCGSVNESDYILNKKPLFRDT